MKFGYRTPNLKNSLRAKTTGKFERTVKKSINPLYGKSGMGYINNPKKAIYNKVYNKTSRSIFDNINSRSNNSSNTDTKTDNNSSCSMYEVVEKNKIRIDTSYYTTNSLRRFAVFFIIISIVLIPLSFFIFPFGIITLIIGIWILFNAYKYLKLCKESDNI